MSIIIVKRYSKSVFQNTNPKMPIPKGRKKEIIALIDMDAFYAQVEVRLNKAELSGQPVGVVQYNQFKKGGLIAVSYEARDLGVKRGMKADEALKVCPSLKLASAPVNKHGKSDLSHYRAATEEIFAVLNSFHPSIIVEKASMDEGFLDLTQFVDEKMSQRELEGERGVGKAEDYPTTFVLSGKLRAKESEREERLREWLSGPCAIDDDHVRLALGAAAVEDIRHRIYAETGFHCSAGIGYSKTLAKLICARHKPRQQTLLCYDYLIPLWTETPVRKVRNLGGKFGSELAATFGNTMGDILARTESELVSAFGPKTGCWLHLLLQFGDDGEEVKAKGASQSIGSGKNFLYNQNLKTLADVSKWLGSLASDLVERLNADKAMHHRTAHSLSFSYRSVGDDRSISKVLSLTSYQSEAFVSEALSVVRGSNLLGTDQSTLLRPIIHMSFNASKFTDGADKGSKSMLNFVTSPKKAADKPGPSVSSVVPSTFKAGQAPLDHGGMTEDEALAFLLSREAGKTDSPVNKRPRSMGQPEELANTHGSEVVSVSFSEVAGPSGFGNGTERVEDEYHVEGSQERHQLEEEMALARPSGLYHNENGLTLPSLPRRGAALPSLPRRMPVNPSISSSSNNASANSSPAQNGQNQSKSLAQDQQPVVNRTAAVSKRETNSERGWLEPGGEWYPVSVDEIDDATWSALPPDVQFEIRSLTRANSTQLRVATRGQTKKRGRGGKKNEAKTASSTASANLPSFLHRPFP